MTYRKKPPKDKPLDPDIPLPDGDYVATDGRLWLQVGNVSLLISAKANGLNVAAFVNGREDEDEIDRMIVPYPEDD